MLFCNSFCFSLLDIRRRSPEERFRPPREHRRIVSMRNPTATSHFVTVGRLSAHQIKVNQGNELHICTL